MSADRNDQNGAHELLREVATAVSHSTFKTATTAYDNARLDGLCHDGAWEIAIDAMQTHLQALNVKVISAKQMG